MMSINGGLQLLQLSRSRFWPLVQLNSQPLTVSLSVSLSQTHCSQSSLTHNTTYTNCMTHLVIVVPEFRNSGIFPGSLLGQLVQRFPAHLAWRVAVGLGRNLGCGAEIVERAEVER